MDNKKIFFISEDQFNTIYDFVKSLKSEWIDIDDRLPENRTHILAYTTNGGGTCQLANISMGAFLTD